MLAPGRHHRAFPSAFGGTTALIHGFIAFIILSRHSVDAQNSTAACTSLSSLCGQCVDYLSDKGETCIYCSVSGICAPAANAGSYCDPSDQSHTCGTNYYTIIFVIVLCSLFCLCFGTCYLKKFRSEGSREGLSAPLLPEVARNFLWRNSLINEGEAEWMCIICGFDNKPRNEYCNMCGTSHAFTLEYKSEKKEEKARAHRDAKQRAKNEKREAAAAAAAAALMRPSTPEPAPAIASPNHSYYSPLPSGLSVNDGSGTTGSKLHAQTLQKLLASNSDASPAAPPLLDEGGPDGGSTWRDSLGSGSVTARLSFSSPSRLSQTALSQAQRTEAFNYRRLNQLSLRQKSARRRKMWQRVLGPDGTLRWVRVSPQETVVGNALFGYTPHNSVSLAGGAGDTGSESGSEADAGGATSRFSLLGVFGLAPSSSSRGRGRQSNASSEGHPDDDADADGGSSRGGGGGGRGGAGRDRDDQSLLEAGRGGSSSRRSAPMPIASSSSSSSRRLASDPAALLASHVGRRGEALSSDSFGDSVVMSGSPGFTSTFALDEGEAAAAAADPFAGAGAGAGTGAGWGLRWERVETGASARRSTMPGPLAGSAAAIGRWQASSLSHQQQQQQRQHSDAAGAGSHPSPSRASSTAGPAGCFSLADQDLVAVAAQPFKDKQLWFLEHMGRLQRPWAEGCVRIEVRRGEHLLSDSVRQFGDLPPGDLHKWMRVQFAGEPGIDAGGLEREWFTLVVQELFSPRLGLFTCSSGDAMGGTYHINPTSGWANPEHLRYFRFAGKLLGKALMEQQVVAATLSLPLRKQILSLPITFSDLEFVDPTLHRNLRWLDTCPDISQLCLDFTVTYPRVGAAAAAASASEEVGAENVETFELKPQGAECPVLNSNKEEYLLLRLRNRMLDSVKPQLEALLRGLYDVVPPDLLSVFDYQELELLLCGVPEISLEDWMRHTDYLSDYARQGARHRVIRWFWLTVEAMSREERVRLLQFTTGCSRLPAQGFKALQSNDGNYRRFNIQAVSKKDSLYPRAHTCFNKLDLPLYDSQQELEAYLSVVVNAEIGSFTME